MFIIITLIFLYGCSKKSKINVFEQSVTLTNFKNTDFLALSGFSDPNFNYINNYPGETISIYDYLDYIYEILQLRKQFKNIIGDEKLIKIFVKDSLVYVIKNDYNLTEEQIRKKYSKEEFKNVTNKWFQIYKKYRRQKYIVFFITFDHILLYKKLSSS